MRRTKLTEVQIARTLAILAVMVVHSTSTGVTKLSYDSTLYPIYNFLNIAGKLGTPTFIMLSSFVLFYNYFPRETNMSLFKKFYIKRLKYILIPYLLVSIFYFGFKWFTYHDYPSLKLALETFLRQLAIGKAHEHLYFVFISVQLYLLFPIFMIIFKKSEWIRKHAVWIGLLLQWVWVYLNKHYFGISIKGSISFSYLSFYFLGAYLGIYYEKIKANIADTRYRDKIISILFLGYGGLLILYTGYMYLTRTGIYATFKTRVPLFVDEYIEEFSWATYAFFAGLVILYLSHVLAKVTNDRLQRLFIEIGATSFGIYLIHPFYLVVLREMVPNGTPIVFHLSQILIFMIVAFLSWFTVRIAYNYIPYSWVIFGSDSNHQKRKKQEPNHPAPTKIIEEPTGRQ